MGAADSLVPDPILIGNGGGFNRGFTGDIADLLIYDSDLSLADFNAVGSNLEFLFGLDTAFPDVLITPEPASIAIWTVLGLTVGGVLLRKNRRVATAKREASARPKYRPTP